MNRVKCTRLRMEGDYFILKAENDENSQVVYSLSCDDSLFENMSLDTLLTTLDELLADIAAMRSACGSTLSAIYAMEEDWRESDDPTENGDCVGQDA